MVDVLMMYAINTGLSTRCVAYAAMACSASLTVTCCMVCFGPQHHEPGCCSHGERHLQALHSIH